MDKYKLIALLLEEVFHGCNVVDCKPQPLIRVYRAGMKTGWIFSVELLSYDITTFSGLNSGLINGYSGTYDIRDPEQFETFVDLVKKFRENADHYIKYGKK